MYRFCQVRTVLVVLTILVTVAAFSITNRAQHAHFRQQIVAELSRRGWRVVYEPDPTTIYNNIVLKGTASVLGMDFVARPTLVQIGNQFTPTNEDLTLISRLDSVEVVSIVAWKSDVDDCGLEALGELRNLRTLLIYNSSLTDRSIRSLRSCRNLTTLVVVGAQLTEESLAHFQRMTNLRRLTIVDSGLSEELRDKLKRNLERAGCLVQFE
jgi:hypothetical protein